MPAKRRPSLTDSDLNLATLSVLFHDEEKAREFVESKRWSTGVPYCPHCGCEGYALTPKEGSKRPGRKGLKKCKSCRLQFTVRVGTVLEESKLPISKWLMAIHLMTSSKKGVSSHQIARELGVTQKSAWFLTMRIREAMREQPLSGMLTGTVEVDETYVGGRPRLHAPVKSKRGRGTRKTPVVALVERDGGVRTRVVCDVTGETLKAAIRENVHSSATIMTDENTSYRGIGSHFEGGHRTVCHRKGQHTKRDGTSTNTAESFFALIKRGHYGIFHQLSKHHLPRYCDEFGFRWNQRKVSDGERMVAAINGIEGKRLRYG